MTSPERSNAIVLVSEARGEFLMVEGIRRELDRLGMRCVHVTAHSTDATPEELDRTGVTALDAHPACARFAMLSSHELMRLIYDEDVELATNLRRVWTADLRSWREGASDQEMAKLALGYLAAWRDVLQEHAPVGLLWGEDGGHLAKRTAFLLAESSQVPLVFIYVSPLPGRMLHLDNALNRFDHGELRMVEPTDDERAVAARLLADIHAGRVQFATPRNLDFHPRRVTRLGRLLLQRYVTRPPGAASLYPWTFARQYARQRLARAALRHVYRPIGEVPFVFHPFHAGFDAQITIRAPQWGDQIALVEHIAASLPYGYELAVKEHPYEVGAQPPARLLSLLRRRPEIRLLDPTLDAREVLRACAAVTTVNSTVGFEALFFGRPLVTFGHGPYRGMGLTNDVESAFDTPALLNRALQDGPPAEGDVVRLIAFLQRRSFEAVSLAYDTGPDNLRRYARFFGARISRHE